MSGFPALSGDRAPLRQAALLLHALGDADRHWMLAQLPREERAPLQALLDELGALGIPPDPAWPRTVLLARRPPDAVAAVGEECASVLQGGSPGRLAGLLAHEPDSLAAQLIAALPAARQDAVLGLLPAGKRRRVSAQLSGCRDAGCPSLMKAAEEEIARLGTSAPAIRGRPLLLEAFRGWMRGGRP